MKYLFKDSSTVIAMRASSYMRLRLSLLQIASMTANRSWSALSPKVQRHRDSLPKFICVCDMQVGLNSNELCYNHYKLQTNTQGFVAQA